MKNDPQTLSQDFYYPDINAETRQVLAILKAQVNNMAYLIHDDCPYPADIKNLLSSFMQPQASSETSNNPNALTENLSDIEIEDIDIEKESATLYHEMRTFKQSLDIDDVSEKAQMFRVSTTLLEKLLDIKERAAGVKEFARFQQLIIDTLDRYLDPTQKSEFVDTMLEMREN